MTDPDRQLRKPNGQFNGVIHAEAGAVVTLEAPAGSADTEPVANSPYAALKGADRTSAMLADLNAAVASVVDSGRLGAYLDAQRANGMRRWSANNRVLVAIQVAEREGIADLDGILARIPTLDAATYKQWGERGRAPRKGEKALYVLAPCKRWVTEDDPDRPGETRKRQVTAGFKGLPVFEVTQTDGDPVPQHPSRPFTGHVADGTVDALRDRVTELGFDYHEKPIASCDPHALTGTIAYVSPHDRQVVVDSRLTPSQQAAALAHEVGHIECGHVDGDPGEYTRHRGRMETEAEAFSYMVMRDRGAHPKDAEAFTPGYIAGWSRGDQKTIGQALGNAESAYRQFNDNVRWPDQHQEA